jgi:hypothetical protein
VERVLSVLDGAVLVISAVEGVQAQTPLLMRALQRLGRRSHCKECSKEVNQEWRARHRDELLVRRRAARAAAAGAVGRRRADPGTGA